MNPILAVSTAHFAAGSAQLLGDGGSAGDALPSFPDAAFGSGKRVLGPGHGGLDTRGNSTVASNRPAPSQISNR